MGQIVFEFLFDDCIWESTPRTVSIHKTKKGAYKAMNKFINDEFNKTRNEALNHGHRYDFRSLYDRVFKNNWYGIKPIELLD